MVYGTESAEIVTLIVSINTTYASAGEGSFHADLE
jgi:hypothetical protein